MKKNQPENQGNFRMPLNRAPTSIAASSHNRESMARSEFIQPRNLSQEKKLGSSRQSLLPSQLLLESSKEAEARSKDMELKCLYNDYLQAMMLEHITKKKSEEVKNMVVRQLANIAKECEQAEEKLLKLKRRERDIKHLSIVQAELDSQIADLNDIFGSGQINTVKEIMSHLYSLLEPLDQLQCNNVILPEKPEEWLALQEAFKECENILGRITELINPHAETYQSVHNGLKDFITMYNDIQSCQKKFDEALTNFQVLVLKCGAFSLK